MWKGMGTRQDFHGEHAAHREAYALRFGPPRMVEVETLVVVKYVFLNLDVLPIKSIDTLYSLHTVMLPIYGSSATAGGMRTARVLTASQRFLLLRAQPSNTCVELRNKRCMASLFGDFSQPLVCFIPFGWFKIYLLLRGSPNKHFASASTSLGLEGVGCGLVFV